MSLGLEFLLSSPGSSLLPLLLSCLLLLGTLTRAALLGGMVLVLVVSLVSWRQQVAWCEDLLRVWSLYQERVSTIYTLPGHQQCQPSSAQLVQHNQLFRNWIFEKFYNILTFFFKQFLQFYMKIDR